MDHLADEYGSINVTVPLVTERVHCRPIESLDAFYAFPRSNGWAVGDDYALKETSVNEKSAVATPIRLDKPALLQSWLFFGLISFVIQTSEGPILQFEDLLDNPNGQYLNTTKLSAALESWWKYELDNRETGKVRMVRTELALEYAQRVVRKNCTFDVEDSGETESISTDLTGDEEVVPLALMVLGETLAAAKARILQSLGSKMRGWNREDEGGWGPPRYVFKKMEDRMWCPRTVHLLQGQLGSNATLLLAALESQDNNHLANHTHKKSGCTTTICKVISGDEVAEELLGTRMSESEPGSVYRPRHESRCRDPKCNLIGPNMGEVFRILKDQNESNEQDRFPILEIFEKPDKSLDFKVKAWSSEESIPYATISHVWSDGLGNEDSNKIYSCQARFISVLLAKVVRIDKGEKNLRMNTMPFWMDTLVIPVGKKKTMKVSDNATGSEENRQMTIPDDFDYLKMRAIRQIYHVFKASAHSIIIDKGLLELDAKGSPWKTVMKILASGWMRRLWTLQEAYLSQRLWITFKQHSGELHDGIEDFDNLVREMVNKENLKSSFAEMAKLKLLQNIMGDERDQWKQKRDPRESGGALLIANTWRAARWRTTSNPAHETLALATLLNLDYRTTSITKAGLTSRRDPMSVELLGDMMCDFWTALNRDWKGSIPPGMIFLSGDKLSKKGFRWAPETWMSALETDHPDPLGTFNCTTELDAEHGLLVEYPGFLIHCPDRKVVLGTDRVDPTFKFPIDRDLLEWYSVEPADKKLGNKKRNPYPYQVLEQPVGESTSLAIILSRSRPREMPSEIGLLVEIYHQKQQFAKRGRKVVTYCCNVIHRVRVCRTKPLYGHGDSSTPSESRTPQRQNTTQSIIDQTPSILQAPSSIDSQICIGELIESDQRWYVDGFDPPPEEPIEEDKEPIVTELSVEPDVGPSLTPKSKSGGSLLGRTTGALSILWKHNTWSHSSQVETVVSADENSRIDAPSEQQVKPTESTTSGTTVEPGRWFIRKRLTGLIRR